jgi:hypothetical protein
MEPIEETGYLEERFKISKALPFEAPEGYFDSLPEKILRQVKLESTKFKDNPFDIPAGYFDTLAAKIEAKTSPVKKPVKHFVSAWYYTMAAAASVAIVLGINFLNSNNASQQTVSEINTDSISSEEISRKLVQMDIDENLLLKAIDPKTIAISSKDQVQVDEKEINTIIDETDINELTDDM